MILTDTHTHIYYHEGVAFDEQIQRCLDKGISRLFLPNVDVASMERIQAVTEAYPENCFPMLGLHPCSVTENYKQDLSAIEKALTERDVVAIGEIGLDLYWDKTGLEWQKEAFRIQVQWAVEKQLPIVIHCREAFDELFTLLDAIKSDSLYGIFHCFTGSYEQALQAIDLGFSLGIGGVVTFKNAGLDKVVERIPLEHLVLETDAPYLAPVPFRGKPNESSYLTYVAQKVANLHQVSLEKVAQITTDNSIRIFGR